MSTRVVEIRGGKNVFTVSVPKGEMVNQLAQVIGGLKPRAFVASLEPRDSEARARWRFVIKGATTEELSDLIADIHAGFPAHPVIYYRGRLDTDLKGFLSSVVS